ncbi:MAG: WYL domain-containing protein [Prevotellaceae bacterium]|jgi:predicted DNA-binding transcriptional regulator YafY|nr:WYL domain-containing protein [Prevotellaceae bacterium]
MKDRKNLPKTALPRLYFIDREIASGKYPNTKELAKRYETGTATISRDIEFMRDMLGAPIEYDAFHRGYFYTEKTYRLPAGFSSSDEMLALGMAKTIISLYRESPIYGAAHNLLESITAPLNDDKNPSWFENRILVPAVASAPVDTELWQVIITGLREDRVLTFDYRSTWDDDYTRRRVHPYQLLFDTGVWYLYTFSEERQAIRIFSLSRIKNAAVTNSRFTLPQNYDYQIKNHGSYFGVFSGDTYYFRIALYEYAAFIATERKWAEDQEIEAIDGGIILKFTSTQYDKVREWVLSRGMYAEPLEPELLVEDWAENVRQMNKTLRLKRKGKETIHENSTVG